MISTEAFILECIFGVPLCLVVHFFAKSLSSSPKLQDYSADIIRGKNVFIFCFISIALSKMLSLNFQFTGAVQKTIDFLWEHIVKTSIAANLLYLLAKIVKSCFDKKT